MHEPLINVPLYGHVCRVFDSSEAIAKRGETRYFYRFSQLLIYVVWVWLSCLTPLSINNISVTSWRSVLLVEETGVPGENSRPFASH